MVPPQVGGVKRMYPIQSVRRRHYDCNNGTSTYLAPEQIERTCLQQYLHTIGRRKRKHMSWPISSNFTVLQRMGSIDMFNAIGVAVYSRSHALVSKPSTSCHSGVAEI